MLMNEHVAYLQRSAERWEARQRFAEHIAHLQYSKRLAMDRKLVAEHVSYLQQGSKRRDSILIAEHVEYLKRSAECAASSNRRLPAAIESTNAPNERQGLLLEQMMMRIERLDAVVNAWKIETAAHTERLMSLEGLLKEVALGSNLLMQRSG